LVEALPAPLREQAAEAMLRRAGTPGPAAEHVLQHLVGVWSDVDPHARSRIAVIAKGADDFYARQYRQFLNGTMGAFAATATQALIGAGGRPGSGGAWRLRAAYGALVEGHPDRPPILVLNPGAVAIAISVPRALIEGDAVGFSDWIAGRGAMPLAVTTAVDGRPTSARLPGTRARERANIGSVLETVDAAIRGGHLAVLALNPTDPDAMGLHITLYGLAGCDATTLQAEYGLPPEEIGTMVAAADREQQELVFLVGGTEEIFTQCSQNLFVKRAAVAGDPVATPTWDPTRPLAELIGAQFELFQTTSSAKGVPGCSPRNGDLGSVAAVVARDGHDVLLIPYHPGNFIHGHAAKLWTNPHGSIFVSDDHHYLRRVALRGPSQVLTPEAAELQYPKIVAAEIARTADAPGSRQPAYWFEQVVHEIVIESDPVGRMSLGEGRETCTISAAGKGRHGKKPAYFAADSLAAYDQELQHHREAAGRPTDPSGEQHRLWLADSAEQFVARREHLRGVQEG
jgi:hypothetical protein